MKMKILGRFGLGCSAAALAIGIALAASPAAAQTTPAGKAADAEADDSHLIIVTGSRIARPQIESPVPVAVVSAASIGNVGHTNLLDALRDLPIVGQSPGTSASNFASFGQGVAVVNLRNLGSSRTLVLINGRRSVGVPGTSAVDLNNIPTDLIERVEVVTGGASAVYGSDAVAGVVNILLKNNFTGIDLHAQDMISSRGDGETPLFSALAGQDFLEGKGHITANFTYTRSKAVPSRARSFSRNDSPTRSPYTPQGLFFDSHGNGYTFDPANNVIPFTGTPDQLYNRASERLLTTPVERYTGSVLGHYDFSDSIQLYGEFTYNRTKASGHLEPFGADDQGTQGRSVFNFDASPFPGISSNNPYVPAAIAAAVGPDAALHPAKRSNGLFDRSPHDKRDYYRGVIGLKGDIGSTWHYDLSYEHSQVRDNTFNEAILMTNYGASLQATTLNGQIVCADPVARAAGCVPINPFGRQTYTPAQIKWLSTYTGQGVTVPGATPGEMVIANFLQKSYQDVASLNVDGSPFDLPGGALGVAIGGEYHREKVSAVYDPFTRSGYSSQLLNGNAFGSFDSKELYGEISAPILGGIPAIHKLELNGAVRFADYSTVGTVWSYKYGGTYAPTPDLNFRATYARAVRAPNLGELYRPQASTAQQVVDPCDQRQGLGESAPTVTLPAGCSAIPGISTYLATHPNFAYTLAQAQTIFGFTGGNPGLREESTDTLTVGGTFTPRFLRNFFLTADYYSIKVKNAVASINPQTAVDQCFQTGSANFCGLVTRNANGFITQVDQLYINAASYKVAGIDVQAGYNFKTRFFGDEQQVSLDFYYNHKFKQQQLAFAGDALQNELGTADTYNSQQLGTGFKDQFTFNAGYVIGPVSLHYRLKYMGPVTATSGSFKIPSYTYHDLQVNFDVAEKFEFYIGANNLLDKQPPFIPGGNSQWPGTNTVADTYDVLGRMIYAGVHVKF
ncbi:TonB-dependent receptor plug domain-containing protein [Rhizorhabdus argentea]|uniref:TonB-dependent receptor plug domain-containing protein n=1 Tax=Rhizorhabdus argentea TaxID=1387174 RepID=UPI0030EEF8EF